MPHAIDPTPVETLLRERIAAGDFPSAVYLIAQRGRVVAEGAFGDAVRAATVRIPATLDTIYDLASLTKPLVTGLLCARLMEAGAIDFDDSVAAHLPEFRRPDKRNVTIRQLLTHTAGLPAWLPLRVVTDDHKARALSVIAECEMTAAPGERVVYSDLGFIALGFLIERVAQDSLDRTARREIFAPLGLRAATFNPPATLRERCAASENGNVYEKQMAAASQRGNGERDVAAGDEKKWWRDAPVWGEVHDGNAHFLGGVAGHAGLFADARETLRLADQFLSARTQLLGPGTCETFRTDMTVGLNEARGAAWQLAATPDSTAGPDLAADCFGHTGFTGTSCWVDPHRERVFILLTNRTHDRQLPFANINGVRRRFHSLAAALEG